jgi:hypothetical protein
VTRVTTGGTTAHARITIFEDDADSTGFFPDDKRDIDTQGTAQPGPPPSIQLKEMY